MTSRSENTHKNPGLLSALPFVVGARMSPGRTAATLGTLFVAASAPAATALATGMVIDAAAASAASGPAAGVPAVAWIVGALIAVFLLGQTATVLVTTVADSYGGALQREVEARAVRAATDGSRAPAPGLGELLNFLREAPPIRQLVTATANHWLTRLQAVLAGCLLVLHQPVLGLAALAAFSFCSLLLEGEYDREQSKAYSESSASRRPRYLSGLAFDPVAAREIKVFRAAEWVVGQYDSAVRAAHGDVRIRVRGIVLLSYATVFVSAVALLVAVAWSSSQGLLTTGEVAVCLAALMGLNGIFAVTMNVVYSRQASALFDQVRRAGLADRTAPLEDPPDSDGTRPPGEAPYPVPGPDSVIRFEGVAYSYPDGTPVFRDLTFELRLRDKIALVGMNGAGKTTLVRLLTGILAPDEGRITCDGRPVGVGESDRAHWRTAFAFLGQNFIRYPATLRENVHLGSGGDTLRGTAAALLDAPVLNAVHERDPVLVKGVQGGADLSGGQWQRVATARAVHRLDAPACRVLVLDEPTAALDAQAEARFFEEADQLVRDENLMIMVSHRLSGVRGADEILVLDEGSVSERGDHSSLMRREGTYAHMFRAQARRYHD